MNEKLDAKVAALIKKAKETGKNTKPVFSGNTSSLHKLIKTKEQADLFMKLLKMA